MVAHVQPVDLEGCHYKYLISYRQLDYVHRIILSDCKKNVKQTVASLMIILQRCVICGQALV